MTKEERYEMGKAIEEDYVSPYGELKDEGEDNLLVCTITQGSKLMDWLNAHYFDYLRLIEKGLALPAPKGMYNLNKL